MSEKGIWKPYSQVLGDARKYIAGRQLNMMEPLHAGNIEYSGDYTEDKETVLALCEKLNAE